MRKWILVAIAFIALGGTWYYVRTNVRYQPSWAAAKFGKVTRGDIRVPITAAGLIEPAQRIEVKPKASGEVVEVFVAEGSWVDRGESLVHLERDYEERNVDRAKADLQRANALLNQAKIAIETAKANVAIARAEVDRLKAEARISLFERDKIRSSESVTLYSEQQRITADARHDVNMALLDAARGRMQNASHALEDAKQRVISQEASVNAAEQTLADAEERLKETTIIAGGDALVTDVFVRAGMLVQSGTQSLTGGTPVMMLADVSSKKVVARVDEADYGRVLDISPVDALPEVEGLRQSAAQDQETLEHRVGTVKLTVDAFPEDTFEGRIERVEPQGKQAASIIQFDVHVVITDERAHMLPLGAQAQVEFTVESAEGVLRIPTDAVKVYQGERGVWVKTPPAEGSAEEFGKRFVACVFGITDGEFTEVTQVKGDADLAEGAEVFTKLPRDSEED